MEYANTEFTFVLCLAYLEAGLPPEAAWRSALADYVCCFSGVENAAPGRGLLESRVGNTATGCLAHSEFFDWSVPGLR
jgi:hypothetical protein